MKRIILMLISVVTLMTACKKNGSSSPKQILLSKVFYDGNLEVEYFYNSEGQIIEEKYYHGNSGAWQLEGRSIFLYDANGHPKEMESWNLPENKKTGRYIFTANSSGQLIRNTIYDISAGEPGTLNFHIDHEYNGNGRLVKKIWKNKEEEMETYVDMNYYPNGNLRTSETFYTYGAPEKVWGTSYGPVDTTLPASFYNIKAYPINYYYPLLLGQSQRNFVYEDGAVDEETRKEVSERKYNDKGLVIEQKITTKHIKPAGPDEVHLMKFEYVQF